MSKKNRKLTYDKLVNDGRFEDIDPALISEFGDPQRPKPKPLKPKKENVKKDGKKE